MQHGVKSEENDKTINMYTTGGLLVAVAIAFMLGVFPTESRLKNAAIGAIIGGAGALCGGLVYSFVNYMKKRRSKGKMRNENGGE